MAINFPNNPTNGQIFSEGNKSWQWLGNRWGTYNIQNPFLGAFRNKIINGDMRIDQRNGGNAYTYATPGNYYGSCDRWGVTCNTTNNLIAQQVATTSSEFPYALRIKRVQGSSSLERLYVGQIIESLNCADLAGQTVTFSFYAKAGSNFSSSGSVITPAILTGSGTDQSWNSMMAATWTGFGYQAFNAVISTTLTKYSYVITIPSNTKQVAIRFEWPVSGTAGADDFVEITGVQLEKGPTATPFEHRPIGTELALCQRYYFKEGSTIQPGYPFATGNTSSKNLPVFFPVTMRSIPAVTVTAIRNENGFNPAWGPTYTGNGAVSTTAIIVPGSLTRSSVNFYWGNTTYSGWGAITSYTADADL